MKTKFGKFYKTCCIAIIMGIVGTVNAAVTQRPTAASTAATNRVGGRTNARMPTTTIAPTAESVTVTEPESVVEPEPEPVIETPEPVVIVDNKTSMFNDVLSETGAKSEDNSADARAEAIRRQRALLDAAGNQSITQTTSGTLTANKCDADLRKCMSTTCGNDFTKCANDSTTIWGEKMASCRRKTKCTGREYTLLAPEILADRDMNVRMSYYNSVIACGDRYNSCIFNECGTTLGKCLAKSDGDRAISKCADIAKECREQDSGLASRVMTVFGDLRAIATEEAQKDEARLREIRNLMRDQCSRYGAMFDERSLDCVYTVNFFAGSDASTPMASKKLYAGDSFQCNANWFGIDVTTFKENAYRLTRSQKSASAAMLGAGIGTATGLLTSGAIDRAIDTRRKDSDVEEAACIDAGYNWERSSSIGGKCTDANGNRVKFDRDNNPIVPKASDGNAGNKKCADYKLDECPSNCTKENGQCVDKSGEERPCNAYSGGKDICEIAHGNKCAWVDTPAYRGCVDRGTENQYQTPAADADKDKWEQFCKNQLLEYNSNTKKCTECPTATHEMKDGKCVLKEEQVLTIVAGAMCYGKTQKNTCPRENCTWDTSANDGKGQCVAKNTNNDETETATASQQVASGTIRATPSSNDANSAPQTADAPVANNQECNDWCNERSGWLDRTLYKQSLCVNEEFRLIGVDSYKSYYQGCSLSNCPQFQSVCDKYYTTNMICGDKQITRAIPTIGNDSGTLYCLVKTTDTKEVAEEKAKRKAEEERKQKEEEEMKQKKHQENKAAIKEQNRLNDKCREGGLGKWDGKTCTCYIEGMIYDAKYERCVCQGQQWDDSLKERRNESQQDFACRRAGAKANCKCPKLSKK